MGYYASRKQYLGTVSKTVNITYPKSESGGSKSVTVEEPVYVDVYVESDPFEHSVDNCDNSLHLLQAGIVAAEAAEKNSRIENSKRLGKSLNDGFFQVVNSNLTIQAKEESANAKALVGTLYAQQKELMKIRHRMEGDYNLIKSRYVKLFEDYDKELHNRIFALNRRTFQLAEESVKELMRPSSSMLTAASLIGQKENLSLQTKITASRVKFYASLVITKVKSFIEGQNVLKYRLRNIISDECRNETCHAPVMCMQVTEKKRSEFKVYSSSLVAKNERISTIVAQRLKAPELNWQRMQASDNSRITGYLSDYVNAAYADSERGRRVSSLIMKLWEDNVPLVLNK